MTTQKQPAPTDPKQLAPENLRVAKIVAQKIASEDKQLCLFHVVHEIPKVVSALPDQHKFTANELVELQVPCNGTALFGVVTPDHPLFGVGLVCELHSR